MNTSEDNTDVIPKHIGLILDGNRRWAAAHGLPSLQGHRVGYENLHTIAQHAFDKGVKYVSAYVFSTENWNRSAEEVSYLMKLTPLVFKKYMKQIEEQKIRVHWMGTRERLSPKILKIIDQTVESTKKYDKAHLCLCFNYGARTELVEAFQNIISTLPEGGGDISQEDIKNNLYAPEVPDMDLVIRTSGEQRLSNFNLWRAAYAELLFVDKHWPDFSEEDLDAAIREYGNRKRRYGA